MKITIAYYLFFFYAAALFKPVLPFFSDFVAHSFAHEHHIATVHHHHGEAHVHKEIAEAASSTHDEEKGPEVKCSDPVSAHLSSRQEYNFSLAIKTGPAYSIFLYRLLSLAPQVILPPPKAALAFSTFLLP